MIDRLDLIGKQINIPSDFFAEIVKNGSFVAVLFLAVVNMGLVGFALYYLFSTSPWPVFTIQFSIAVAMVLLQMAF